MTEEIEDINIDEIEFREITTAEYIAQLEDEDMIKAIRSQVAPMSFAMKEPHKLSPKKLLMLPWGKFSRLMEKFNRAQGIKPRFLGKK